MPQRTCDAPGCPKPHRARGLCSTCYNQQRQPDRHKKSTTACVVCGDPVHKEPSKRYRPVCSMYCRWFLQNPVLSCPLPASHPAHPDYSPPAPRRASPNVDWRMPRTCDECGAGYSPTTSWQCYCSTRCSLRVKNRARTARQHGAQGSFSWSQVIGLFLLFDRRCAYCAEHVDGQPDPDHVVPLSRQGHNGISNILPSCQLCNSDKRDLLLTEWNADRIRRGMPPRITAWAPDDRRVQHLSPGIAPHLITAR